jgi:AraC-like DNA-binding protein
MKAQLHKLPLTTETSFFYSQWDCDFFDKPWHFHEEYELVLIDKSKGTKFIGDAVSLFEDGDLFLIGPNIPHLFKNNEEYYNHTTPLKARSIFLHFTEDFLGNNFLNVPEMKLVRELLDKSSFALQINGKVKEQVVQQLDGMHNEDPPRRLLSLLEILIRLSESSELEPLLATRFSQNKKTKSRDADRIHTILEFIMDNYNERIYISEVASMFGMSDASFSRYFKHHTRKTFSSYVTEIRISHACRLLMQSDESIAQVGYLSGFENLSNFYRHFKKITGMIPKDYRNRFEKIAEGV